MIFTRWTLGHKIKRTINKEVQEFKGDTRKLLNEIKEKEISDTQGNTIIKIMEMMETVENVTALFNQEIETLKRTQVEMKIELKNIRAQP